MHTFQDLDHAQRHFDTWRNIYNLERPHESLGMQSLPAGIAPRREAFPRPPARLSTTRKTWFEKSKTAAKSG